MHGLHFTLISSYVAALTGINTLSVEMVLIRDQAEKPAVLFRGSADGSYVYPAETMELGKDGIEGYIEFLSSDISSVRELDAEECKLLYSLIGDKVLPHQYDV